MPEITIEQQTFERLQDHAQPFIDTPDSVVRRALDALDNLAKPDTHSFPTPERAHTDHAIDPDHLPNLKYTRVQDASMDGVQVRPANWNSLLRQMLVRAQKHFDDFDQLRRVCTVNMIQGRKDDDGYRYIEEIHTSYQGLNANAAAAASVALAKYFGIALEVYFQWRQKEQALHPGKRACLRLPSRRPSPREGGA